MNVYGCSNNIVKVERNRKGNNENIKIMSYSYWNKIEKTFVNWKLQIETFKKIKRILNINYLNNNNN